MSEQQPRGHDIAILGTGIAGSMLGSILAKNGASVVLIDAGAHPKFAIGESTIPYTLVTLRTLAERYGVPEIKTLATFTDCTKRIGPHFGVKKHFAFLRHDEGEEQDPLLTNQFNTPGIMHEASHMFRQETDAYMYHVAIKYGCDTRPNFRVADIDIDDTGVALKNDAGEEIRAQYVVDGGGFRSPLAEMFGLRENPCRFKHHSRSLFTHMVDVKVTDDVLGHPKEHHPPVAWHEGTVHHLFERGWFWVIPFNNHKDSRNPLCSVGLTMDPRVYPKDESLTPEEEFRQYADRFPVVARQFDGAESVREWISTDRLQYSSSAGVGDRFCLLPHAYGFIDPLFSRGLSNTAEVINSLSWRLLRALQDGDFSAQRFDFINRIQRGLLDYNDALVNCSFISFSSYPLWNAVFRIWAYGSNVGTFRMQQAISGFWRDGSDAHFRAIEDPPNPGLWWPDHEGYKQLVDHMIDRCEAFERGEVSGDAAAKELFDHMQESDFILHPMGFSDPSIRFLNPTPKKMLKTVKWARKHGAEDVRDLALETSTEAVKMLVRGRKIF